ncbi:TauD/TfdA dioxygenase family protein [Paraburkholderia metrosideri]|uniref:Alpha-ketoglutarate-dependent sulfate ester dioxygenase n=1 Tax=Paraburkholderia metrosideri TaxID=580937 RepID=A0ABM8NJV0_9BURK|nr:TauD/TfdA family dioxygenase [Paraburkholderia metrosideri]CAD6529099.1 Alpha-ketoglutarate-dependent sulfate ester dioxygenase [Paraburkholderia metrosideri]
MSSSAETNLDTSFENLRIRRVAGLIGGEVQDIKLSPDLDDAAIDTLHRALVKYKVLFFRDQSQLDDASHQAFGTRFGDTIAHPTVPSPEGTKLFELDASKGGGRADSWHTDITFIDAFPKISILRGVKIPAYGGDTVWANTAVAYERLPDDLKRLADSLWAVHTNDYDYGAERVAGTDSQSAATRLAHHQNVFVSAVYEAEHPIVHVHPVSGEKALLLGHFIKRIVGLSSSESARIFEILQNRVIRLENTVRWQWRQNDVVIWDNRATQHYAVNDYGTQDRLVRRVTVAGERAVSIDGRHSRTLREPQQAPQTDSKEPSQHALREPIASAA